jgi:integrase
LIERQNYLKTRQHLKYLEEVFQLSQASLERYRFYLRHLLLWADDNDFSKVARIRPTLPAYLASLPGKDGKGNLAFCSQKKVLDTSKRFFKCARATYPKEMAALPMEWIDTLRMARHAQSYSENIFVSEEEVKQLISFAVPDTNLAMLRERAAAAFLFLSGMRATAFTTMPISALDLNSLTIKQWPELGVRTKNSKKATTFLLNIPDLLVPVRRWDAIVRSSLPANTPWYAPIDHNWGEQCLSTKEPGKSRSHAIDRRLRILFEKANLEFKSPHKFRHGHAVYGLLHAKTMADYKAVSMNLMHDSIEITDNTYAPMVSSDVQERIAGLNRDPKPSKELSSGQPDDLDQLISSLGKENLGRALVLIAGKLTL